MLKLEGQISLDGSQWERGIEHATDSIKELVLSSVGFATVSEGFIKMAETAKEFAESVKDGADRLGSSTEEFQRYAFAAAKSGTNIETFQGGLDKLSVSIEEAKNGNEKTIASFARFGITLDDLIKKKPYEIFDDIGKSIEETGVNSKVTASAMDLLGKSGSKLIPMLKELKEAKGGAVVVSDEDLAKVDEAGKTFNSIKQNLKSGVTTLAAQIAEPTDFLAALFSQGEVAGQMRNIQKMRNQLSLQQAMRGITEKSPVETEQESRMAEYKAETAKKDHEKALEIEKKITEEIEKQKLENVTPEEKRIELLNRIKTITADIEKLKKEGGTETQIAEQRLNLEKAKTQLGGIKLNRLPQKQDSLISVGNFLGTGSNAISNIAQKQLEIAKKQLAYSAQFNSVLSDIKTILSKNPFISFPFS